MLMFLEIALTIAAWRKGWGARALLPLVIGFGVAILMGIVVGSAGGSTEDVRVPGIICDVGMVIALSILARRAPRAAAEAPVKSSESDELQLHLNQ